MIPSQQTWERHANGVVCLRCGEVVVPRSIEILDQQTFCECRQNLREVGTVLFERESQLQQIGKFCFRKLLMI
jgi:hypothetical protein